MKFCVLLISILVHSWAGPKEPAPSLDDERIYFFVAKIPSPENKNSWKKQALYELDWKNFTYSLSAQKFDDSKDYKLKIIRDYLFIIYENEVEIRRIQKTEMSYIATLPFKGDSIKERSVFDVAMMGDRILLRGLNSIKAFSLKGVFLQEVQVDRYEYGDFETVDNMILEGPSFMKSYYSYFYFIDEGVRYSKRYKGVKSLLKFGQKEVSYLHVTRKDKDIPCSDETNCDLSERNDEGLEWVRFYFGSKVFAHIKKERLKQYIAEVEVNGEEFRLKEEFRLHGSAFESKIRYPYFLNVNRGGGDIKIIDLSTKESYYFIEKDLTSGDTCTTDYFWSKKKNHHLSYPPNIPRDEFFLTAVFERLTDITEHEKLLFDSLEMTNLLDDKEKYYLKKIYFPLFDHCGVLYSPHSYHGLHRKIDEIDSFERLKQFSSFFCRADVTIPEILSPDLHSRKDLKICRSYIDDIHIKEEKGGRVVKRIPDNLLPYFERHSNENNLENHAKTNLKLVDLLLRRTKFQDSYFEKIKSEIDIFLRRNNEVFSSFHTKKKNGSLLLRDIRLFSHALGLKWFRDEMRKYNSYYFIMRVIPFFFQTVNEAHNNEKKLSVLEDFEDQYIYFRGYIDPVKPYDYYFDKLRVSKLSKTFNNYELLKKADYGRRFLLVDKNNIVGFRRSIEKKGENLLVNFISSNDNLLFFDSISLSLDEIDQAIRTLEKVFFERVPPKNKHLRLNSFYNSFPSYLRIIDGDFDWKDSYVKKYSGFLNILLLQMSYKNKKITNEQFVKGVVKVSNHGLLLATPVRHVNFDGVISFKDYSKLIRNLQNYFHKVDMKGSYDKKVTDELTLRLNSYKMGSIKEEHFKNFPLRFLNISKKNMEEIDIIQYLSLERSETFHQNVKEKLPLVYQKYRKKFPTQKLFLSQ